MLGNAREAFDDAGLVDAKAREIVERQLAAFATWIAARRVREAELG